MMTDSVAKVVAETITEAEAVGAEHKHSIETWWNVSGVTFNRGMFSYLDENFQHSVKLGNNSRMAVVSKGRVKLLINGIKHVVNDVYYVPELKNNLLSIG
jgi:hypothetical protein